MHPQKRKAKRRQKGKKIYKKEEARKNRQTIRKEKLQTKKQKKK